MRRFVINASTALVLGLGLTLALLWLLTGPPQVARADATPVHYVAPIGADSPDCTNPANPCQTVQYAVDQAGDGDTVKVATGAYTATASQVVSITRNITLTGGYAPPDWTTSDPGANPTILDGQHARRVIYVASNHTVTLDGLRIVNGNGGGVYSEKYSTGSHLTIRNCDIFTNATGTDGGGGVFLWGGSLLLQNSRLVSNTAGLGAYGDGGGVYARGATVSMTHNVFRNNAGADGGGGVRFYECTAYVAHNTFQDNFNTKSGGDGGGLHATWGDLILTDNVVRDNTASRSGSGYGGGLHLTPGAGHTYTVTDNLIEGNVASLNEWGSGGGAYMPGSGWLVFSHNQVISNVASQGSKGTGGGLYASGPARLSDNLIQGNRACTGLSCIAWGGGVAVNGEVWLEGNRILDNWANEHFDYWDTQGGGVAIGVQDNVTMTNNIIAGNRYADRDLGWPVDNGGGAIYIGGQTSPSETQLRLYHNTFANNQSPAILSESAAITMSHTIFYSQTTDLKTIFDTSQAGSSGLPTTVADYTLWWPSMNLDPRDGSVIVTTNDFTGTPDFASTPLDGYHLGSASEAIDRGPGAGVTTDVDGHLRPLGSGFELGADEYAWVDLAPSTKRASPEDAIAGTVVTFTILLRNSGNWYASDTVLSDAIPTPTTYVPNSVQASSGIATDAGQIGWAGTISPGQAITITFRVTVNEGIVIQNTAVVTYGDTYGYDKILSFLAFVNAERVYLPLVLKNY